MKDFRKENSLFYVKGKFFSYEHFVEMKKRIDLSNESLIFSTTLRWLRLGNFEIICEKNI